jgi:hypothetical protein
MGSNNVRKEWKRQNPGVSDRVLERRFIDKYWSKCIDFARATMAHMLGRPDVDPAAKELIYEALQLDATLPVGRFNSQEASAMLMNGIRKDVLH